jgi:hypothetical protein
MINSYPIIVETTKPVSGNGRLSNLRYNNRAKLLKYMKMRKEQILHLSKQVKFEEFEIYLLIRKA